MIEFYKVCILTSQVLSQPRLSAAADTTVNCWVLF